MKMHRKGQLFYLILAILDNNSEKENTYGSNIGKQISKTPVPVSNEPFLFCAAARSNREINIHKKPQTAYFQILIFLQDFTRSL